MDGRHEDGQYKHSVHEKVLIFNSQCGELEHASAMLKKGMTHQEKLHHSLPGLFNYWGVCLDFHAGPSWHGT